MLPLYLLTSIKGQPILVELKSGETINGTLENCDSWMNLTLKQAITVDPHGENFAKLTDVYVRGNQIKYVRMSNEIIDRFKEQQQHQQQHQNNNDRYSNSQGQRYGSRGGQRRRGGNFRGRGRAQTAA